MRHSGGGGALRLKRALELRRVRHCVRHLRRVCRLRRVRHGGDGALCLKPAVELRRPPPATATAAAATARIPLASLTSSSGPRYTIQIEGKRAGRATDLRGARAGGV